MRAHILFLIDELCRKGGAECALLNTVRWLPARFRFTVVTFRIDPKLPLLADFPCPVRLMPLRRAYDWNALKMGIRLVRLIHQERVDIVHTFFASADLWGGAIATLSGRAMLVSSRRDMGFQRLAKHRVAYRALRGMFDQVITVSEQVRRFSIEQDRLDPARVTTIYNAIDLRKFRTKTAAGEVREQFDLSGASHVVVSVGNLRWIKGVDVFIRAAAQVCRDFPQAVFVVAGGTDPAEPQYLQELQALCADLGIVQNLRFLGMLEDVIPLLKASDVFCLLSRSEGFSNALLEAMACGLPCVATRVGGNGEALEDAKSGFLVQSEDYETAALRVCQLLRDPAMAQRMGTRAQASTGERFAPEIVTSQLVEVYEELLGARKRLARGRQ
jgi:glycosyltransferase involved in cell wall biosynthesis